MRRSRSKPSKKGASHASQGSKTRAGPRVSTSAHSSRGVSPEEPTSPNPRPSKMARRNARDRSPSHLRSDSRRTGMARFEEILAGSSLARASQEASVGRTGSSSAARGRGGGSSSKYKEAKSKGEAYVVNTIFVVPYGVVENTDSEPSKQPKPLYSIEEPVDLTPRGIAAHRQIKLCAMSHEGFKFRTTDSYSDVNSVLRSALPDLFDHLLAVELAADSDEDDDERFLSSWLICIRRQYVKTGTTLDVFSDDRSLPNGADIVAALQLSHAKSKVPPQDRVLYLTTRHAIPDNVIDSWRPRAAGSSKRSKATKKSVMVDTSSNEDDAISSDTTNSDGISDSEGQLMDNGEAQDIGDGEEKEEEVEVDGIINISSDDETPVPAARGTRSVTAPVEEPVEDVLSRSLDFTNSPNYPWTANAD